MKHKLFTLLLAIMASVSSLFAQSGTCGNNLTWNLTNGVLTISGTGDMTDYSSSSDIPWYSYRSSIQYAVIGNGVTSIGKYAFESCSSLTSVTIPNSVTSIGHEAFYYCTGLTSITIPNSVTSIGSSALRGCNKLTNISVGTNNPNYSSLDGVLFNKDKTTLVQYPGGKQGAYIIPNSVTSIGDAAFWGGNGLTSVTIPNSITSIGDNAFTYTGLTSITIPNSVINIMRNAFSDCTSLTSINVNTSNPNYCSLDGVLFNKDKTTLVQYPGGKQGAYIIPNSVTSIREYAFSSCTGLISVTIPKSVINIGFYAFVDCRSLPVINSIRYADSYLVEVTDETLSSHTIQEGTKWIGDYAFDHCRGLTSITIPNSVTSIGYGAFYGCDNLTSVKIPNSVTDIGNYAFAYCTGLASVTIPNKVTSIGYRAFNGCSGLTSITLSEKLASIGYGAFSFCVGLTSVTNNATTPQTISKYMFEEVNISSCTLHVPAESLTAYKTATIWKDFGTIQAISGDTPCTPISGTCGGNLTWELSCDSILTIRGTGAMANIGSASDIPWYEYRDAIKSIVIGNGVTSIAGNAFQKCTNLTSVTIPNSVTSIGQVAFYECTALTSVTIPNRVTSIGMGAFTYCSSLTSITIPNSVTSLGQAAFGYCTGLHSVTIGSGITSIEQGLFGNCSSLTSVTIPNNVTSIGQVAFIGCTSLTSVTIPNSVTSIGIGAFSGCSSLTSVTLPDGITSIEQETFGNCSSLTSVTIPNSVTSIEIWAFENCTALTSVTIPSSVTSIGDEVFSGCIGLRSVTNYATTPQAIDAYVFDYVNISACTLYVPAGSLAAYKKATIWKNFGTILAIDGNTPCLIASGTCGANLTWELTCDSVLTISGTGAMADFNSTSDNPWYNHRNAIKSVIIGDGITSIGKGAFYNCIGLTSVAIGNKVTSIGMGAFQNCIGLTSVTIPNSVTSIEYGAFKGCSVLRSVIIGNSVTSIGDYAFEYCSSLTSVEIPNSVTSIGYGAFGKCSGLASVTIDKNLASIGNFAFYNCSSLTSVTNYATTPQTITTNVFGSVNISACTLYVPAGSLAAYRTATIWKDFGTIQAISGDTPCTPISGTCGGNLTWELSCDSILTIRGTGAMANIGSASDIPWYEYRDAIKSIVIGNGVTSIAGNAFQKCTNLTSVTIPNSVTSIGQVAFYECTALTSVTIPNRVTSIGMGAFTYCSSLTSITIPNSVTSLGQAAFGYCTGLHSVTIGSGITSIEQGLFGNCSSLTSVTIPNNVTSIGQVAFIGCTSLTSVTIPNSVTSIGIGAFSGCSSLTSVTLPDGITSIEQETFGNCSSLTSVTIPNSVTSIEIWAFENCTALTSVTIPSSVTSIGDEVFSGCIGLRSVTNYATTPQAIDAYVFDYVNISACTLYVPAGSLAAYKKATIWKNFGTILAIDGNTPCLIASGTCGANLTWELSCDSVLTISGTGAMDVSTTSPWDYRNAIKSVIIGNSVTSIGSSAFSDCKVLTSVTIVNSVTSIGDDAFIGCTALTSVTIPSSVTSIGHWAFNSCRSLTSVTLNSNAIVSKNYNMTSSLFDIFGVQVIEYTIGNTVTSIGDWAFRGCSSLTSVMIPNSVTSIGNYAFYYCTGLTSVTIPNSVTNIRSTAFFGCSALKSINVENGNPNYISQDGVLFNKGNTELIKYPAGKTTSAYDIPNSVTSIGSSAFSHCRSLTSVTIPNSVTSIGSDAFRGCSGLTSVTIGKNLTSIEIWAFENCTSLTSVTNYATTPQTLITNVFDNVNISSCTLYVPAESLSAYRTADVWKDFGQILPINAEDTDVTTTTVTASATTADIVWPKVTGAVTYTLEIKKNGELICTLTFDAEGHLISMSFAAPSRHNAPHQTQAAGFSFTITGLESGTTYNYTMIVKGSDGNVLKTESGTFTTIGTQGIEDLQCNPVQGIKILRNGQIFIQRGEKIYTITGQEIQSY